MAFVRWGGCGNERGESAGNFRDSGLLKVVRHVAAMGNENTGKWENPGLCATFVPKIPESLTKRRAIPCKMRDFPLKNGTTIYFLL